MKQTYTPDKARWDGANGHCGSCGCNYQLEFTDHPDAHMTTMDGVVHQWTMDCPRCGNYKIIFSIEEKEE